MIWRRGILLLAGAAGVLAARVEAQDRACVPTMTLESCYRTLLGEEDAGDVSERAAKAPTGPQTVAGETETSIRDFLPRLGVALLVPGLEGDDEALAVKFNEGWTGLGAQIGVQLNQPELFAPLVDSVPLSLREAARSRLEDDLEDQDDVSFSFALNLETRRWGRRFAPHSAEVRALVGGFLPGIDAEVEAALTELGPRLVTVAMAPDRAAAPECRLADRSERQLDCYESQDANDLAAALRALAEPVARRLAANQVLLAESGLEALATLLGNQPQLNLSASYNYRADPVGPDQGSLSFRFEHGFRNLNWLRGQCGGALTSGCFQQAMGSSDARDELAKARRLYAQVDVSYIADYDASLPEGMVRVVADRSLEVKLDFGYGQYFGRLSDGPRRSRVDFGFGGVISEEGDLRNDRLIGKLTYTLPVSDQFSAVLGGIWANKPEFVGDVDRNLSANLGVTYKLVQREQ